MADFDQFDAIREQTSTEGLGAYELNGSPGGMYRTIASKYADGHRGTWFVRDQTSLGDATAWERFIGVYDTATNSVSRDTLLDSSTDEWIDWPEGTRIIEVSPAPKHVVKAGSGCTVTRDPATGEQIVNVSVVDTDDQTAAEVPFTPAGTIAATNVQAALEELASDIVALGPPIIDFKNSVRVATTANITLSGEQTIDGVSVIAGDRVLVKDQSTASQNGIYVCGAGAWSRATDADDNPEVTAGMVVLATEGATNAERFYQLTTDDPITVGTTALTFAVFSGLVTSVFGRTGAVTATSGDYTATQITFTPAGTIAATNVQAAIEELDGEMTERIDDRVAALLVAGTNVSLVYNDPAGTITVNATYDDDDVIDALADVLEDGYGINWNLFEDSLGTHLQPDRIVSRSTDSYAAEIAIDLARSPGEWHRVETEGNSPTLAVVNFEHNDPAEPGKKFVLEVVKDANGNGSIDFAGSSQTWSFPDGEPALSRQPNGVDYLEFLVIDVETPEFLFIRPIHRPRRHDDYCEPPSTAAIATTVEGLEGIQNRLDSYWKFDETGGGTRYDDIGSNDIAIATGSAAGIISNGATYSGVGTGGSKNTPTGGLASIDHDFTVFGWFKVASVASSGGAIVSGRDGGGNFRWQLDINSNKARARISKVGGGALHNVSATTFGDLSNDTLYFVAMRWNETTHDLSISINAGTADTSNAGAGAYVTTIETLTFGYLPGSTLLVDEWGYAPSLLTDDDLTAIYNSGSGDTTPFSSDINEEQTLTITGSPTKGSLVITFFPGDPEEADVTLPFNASAATAETLINNVLGAGSVDVTGGPLPGTPLVIEYTGDYAGTNVTEATVDDEGLNGHARLDWRREINYVLLTPGTYTPTIDLGDVQPWATIRVALETDTVTGTPDFDGVDFGDFGAPDLPVDETFDLFLLTAVSPTVVIGQLVQSGCTPEA